MARLRDSKDWSGRVCPARSEPWKIRSFTRHHELLIGATGSLTAENLSSGVIVSLVRNWTLGLRDWIATNGPGWVFKILLLAAILFVFRLLSRVTREVARKAIRSSKLKFTRLLRDMIVSARATSSW